ARRTGRLVAIRELGSARDDDEWAREGGRVAHRARDPRIRGVGARAKVRAPEGPWDSMDSSALDKVNRAPKPRLGRPRFPARDRRAKDRPVASRRRPATGAA